MSLQNLTTVFREVFEDDQLVLTPTLSARDLPNWDSFNHINLIIGIESAFSIAFTTEEVATMQNVGDLINLLHDKGCNVEWQ